MGLETGTYISDLNANNPVNATDVVGEGDDHLRLIKSTLLNTFPNVTGEVTLSHEQINQAARKDVVNVFLAEQTVSANSPQWRLNETDQAANSRMWIALAASGAYQIRAYSDDLSTSSAFISATRSGTSITELSLQVASGELALRALANGAVSLYHDNGQRIRTAGEGMEISGGADTPYIGLYNNAFAARLGFVQMSGDALFLRNEVHGGRVFIQGEDAGGTLRNVLVADTDNATELYYNGTRRLATTAAGELSHYSDGSTETENRFLGGRFSNGTMASIIGHYGSGSLLIRNMLHGWPITLQAEDAGGTLRNLFHADPDGDAIMYRAGGARILTTGNGGALRQNTDDNTTRNWWQIEYSNGGIRGHIGYDTTTELEVTNRINGGATSLKAFDSGGVIRNIVTGTGDGAASLYHDGTETLRTASTTAADGGTGAEVRDGGNNWRPVGMNIIPTLFIDGGNGTLALSNVGYQISYNTGVARTIFANNDGNIPVGAAWTIWKGPSGGTLTLDGGTGVTIIYWNGADYSTTAAAGNLTLGEGRHFLYKRSDTEYVIDGPGIT